MGIFSPKISGMPYHMLYLLPLMPKKGKKGVGVWDMVGYTLLFLMKVMDHLVHQIITMIMMKAALLITILNKFSTVILMASIKNILIIMTMIIMKIMDEIPKEIICKVMIIILSLIIMIMI